MTKTELLEIWGFLDVLKSDYQKRILKDNYSFEESKRTDEKHYKRLIELQRLIEEEAESK